MLKNFTHFKKYDSAECTEQLIHGFVIQITAAVTFMPHHQVVHKAVTSCGATAAWIGTLANAIKGGSS